MAVIAASGLMFVSMGLLGYEAGILIRERMSKAGAAALSLIPAIKDSDKEMEIPAINKVSKRLSAIFITVPSKKLLKMYLLSYAVLGLLGLILTRSVIGLILGCGVASILPGILVTQLENKHKNKFNEQLVDMLMILSSSLKAGLSLIQAIEEVVTELPPPTSQELSLVLRENRMGVPLEDTLVHLKERLKLEELNLVITAILVARETGGDLTQTFTQLTFTIREKKKLHGRVKSLCVQAKLQGIIMGFLPIVFAIGVYSMDRHYFDIMLKEQLGQALLCYGIISEIIGLILIKVLSRIKV